MPELTAPVPPLVLAVVAVEAHKPRRLPRLLLRRRSLGAAEPPLTKPAARPRQEPQATVVAPVQPYLVQPLPRRQLAAVVALSLNSEV